MAEQLPAESDVSRAPRARLSLAKKALFGMISVVVLGLLELGLVVAGVEPATGAKDPFVGFSSRLPHLEVDGDVVRRAPSRATVLNDIAFPRDKPAGTTRVVCLGGSTTYGRPFWDETSFAGYLREMLPAATGGAAFDVVNAGAMSYASYRVTGLMREAARFEPDVFVVLAGHNEFLERRTYGELHEMSPFVREVSALLAGTRTGTVLQRLAGSGRPPPEGLDEKVSRTAIDAVGPDAYQRDDAWSDVVTREFRAALHGMADVAESAGAVLVFVVPASNVRDFPPFKSQASSALDPADVPRFLAQLDAGRNALSDGRGAAAVAPLREAVGLDPRYAEAWYLLGRALLATGEPQKAEEAFLRALEEDVCALRAGTAIQEAVRSVARQRGLEAVELEELVAAPGGAGSNAFADHVHLWPSANAALAEAIVDALGRAGAVSLASSWTEAAARNAAARVDARIDAHVHGTELVRLTYVLASLGKTQLARDVAARATALLGGDPPAILSAAEALREGGDTERAVTLAAEAAAAAPEDAASLARAGAVFADGGAPARARATLEAAIAIDPERPDALARLGVLAAKDGDLETAEARFRAVIGLRPEVADAHWNLALVLLRQSRQAEATRELEEALRLDPEHAEARRRLDQLRR